ncbi:MAG: NAD(P)-binding protein [Candidatus Hodarchaeota archaeon]
MDCPKVVDVAKNLEGVSHSEEHLSFCTESGANAIQKAIEENDLDRIVIAACTPKTHEPVFQSVLKAANLPKRMMEFVNIREHDSFVHMHDKDEATEKAISLIRAAVSRAKQLEDVPVEVIDVEKRALVIGGGAAGLQAALDLAKLEYDVTVVESSPTTGGKMAKLDRTFPTDDCSI